MEHYCTQETWQSSMQGTSGSWDLQCTAAFRSCQHHTEGMKRVSPGSRLQPAQAHHALCVLAQGDTLGRDLLTAGLGTV